MQLPAGTGTACGIAKTAGHPQLSRYLPRQLKSIIDTSRQPGTSSCVGQELKLFTWNILAQCLVQRKLFPGSDCLKWKDRSQIVTQEIIDYDPDVICLQEVDRVEHYGPVLSENGFEYVHVIGYEEEGKKHGLLIGWKRILLHMSRHELIMLDKQQFRSRNGLSRYTRNIALLCCLQFNHRRSGLVIGTTHLFWHPSFHYERVRQTAFLSRASYDFRNKDYKTAEWPLFLAGDFNEEPGGPAYEYLSGQFSPAPHDRVISASSVVHQSVDRINNKYGQQYVNMSGDEDRVLKDVRPAQEEDGLFSLEELQMIFGVQRWVSLYGRWGCKMTQEENNRFMDRPGKETPISLDATCAYEPMWTNLTPLWRCTVDYIWILDEGPALKNKIQVIALLPTHRTDVLEPGLPRLGMEPSDHVALMAVVTIA